MLLFELIAMNAEQQLTTLGLTLPTAPPRGGVYNPVVIVGNIAYVSGHGPYLGDGKYLTGRVGADLDLEAGKVTLKHGEIKHLDMPGMTMVFTVRDKGLLATVKPGDKIKFMAVSEGGKLIVTDIQPIR